MQGFYRGAGSNADAVHEKHAEKQADVLLEHGLAPAQATHAHEDDHAQGSSQGCTDESSLRRH